MRQTTFKRIGLTALVVAAGFGVHDSAHAQRTNTTSELASRIEAVLGRPSFDQAFWGVLAVDLETGQTLFSRNENRRFLPASNLKLISTAGALDALGTDFRYETSLFLSGDVHGDTLLGDLVIRGAGDPTFGSTRFGESDPMRPFHDWEAALRARGIQHITGDVIGDDNIFDDIPYGLGWAWDDFVFGYGAEVSGLTFYEGAIQMTVRGTSPGNRAAISWQPLETDYIRVDNQSQTLSSGSGTRENYARDLSSNRFTVASEVAEGRRDTDMLAIHNPTVYAAHMLRLHLLRSGIGVEGTATDVDDLASGLSYVRMERVATTYSPSLSDIVAETNRESVNLFADHLLRTLGALRYSGIEAEKGSVEAGVLALQPMLTEAGISSAELQMVDGSGLSFMNRVTPRALVNLLTFMNSHSDREIRDAFYESLPVGGRTGTLSRRYSSGDARGNVHAKTGYINGVRTLSGYVMSAAGHRIAFSILCNHYATRTSIVNEAQDDVVELLADYTGR